MRRLLFVLSVLVLGSATRAWAQSIPAYSASPSAQTGLRCDGLRVVSTGRYVPSNTQLEVVVGGATSELTGFVYDMGNGVIRRVEGTDPTLRYVYQQPGTYQIRVEVLGKNGTRIGSEACRAEVRVEATPVAQRITECRGLEVNELSIGYGGVTRVSSRTVRYAVVGKDNKEPIGQYKMDFGDGVVEESSSNVFEHTYAQDGTYTAQAAVRASDATEYARDIGWCTREVQVGSISPSPTPSLKPGVSVTPTGVKGIEKQPETGAPVWFLIGSLGLLGTGVMVLGVQAWRN